jgi:hypothetical protein
VEEPLVHRFARVIALTFVIPCVAVVSTTACHETTSPTRAFSASVRASADTLAIEDAVAEHFKPWVTGKNVTLDSRFGMSPRDAERPFARTQELARILGVPVAHTEDVLACKAGCTSTGQRSVIAITTVTIKGDTARTGILTVGVSDKSRRADAVDEEVIVTKANGVWTFTRVEKVNVS